MRVVNMLTTSVGLSFYSRVDQLAELAWHYLVMNLSHVINEFSFGPYFPDIVQPLDSSFELTNDRASFPCDTIADIGLPIMTVLNSVCGLSIFPERCTHNIYRSPLQTFGHQSILGNALYACTRAWEGRPRNLLQI